MSERQHSVDNQPQLDATTSPLPPSGFLPHLPSSERRVFHEESLQPTAKDRSVLTGSKAHADAHGRVLNPRSCVTCRKRKIKCDKNHPCANCDRAHIECVFPAPGRAPRKVRKLGDGKDKELMERLQRLEGVVKELGVEMPGAEVHTGTNVGYSKSMNAPREGSDRSLFTAGDKSTVEPITTHQSAARDATNGNPSVQGSAPEQQIDGTPDATFGRLVIHEGRSRYINNSFWSNLSNEVEDLKGIVNESDDENEALESSSDTHAPSQGDHQGWIFGFSSQNAELLALHPRPVQIQTYWDIYKDRVDPVVKVLHIPSVEPTILSASSHLTHLSKGFEAILFAVYYSATTSLSPDECTAMFGEDRSILLSRYRFAVEQALARANILVTEEVVVLQAFVVFLVCLRRNSDARVIWTLTGLAVRIAQTIGIHRDGQHFGLSPLEIEVRRRLWWQICLLDIRTSEDHGCDPTITEDSFDTKPPLNINDSDISSDSKQLPPERQGCTEISFCLLRFETSDTFRKLNYTPPGSSGKENQHLGHASLAQKEQWITECHNRLESRYLRHCDMTVPLYWVTATVARLIMSKMWLMIYHPFQRKDGGKSLSAETKETLFITSLENIEYAILLETEERTKKWGWLFKTYMQWHALAFLLSELCHRTSGGLVERAWMAVEKIRKGHWGMEIPSDSRAGHLWGPLKKLHRKARSARQLGLQQEAQARQQMGLSQMKSVYSPNQNPMFERPAGTPVVSAPLSQAQLHRFSQGPAFGNLPFDKHELMMTPRNGSDASFKSGGSIQAPGVEPNTFTQEEQNSATVGLDWSSFGNSGGQQSLSAVQNVQLNGQVMPSQPPLNQSNDTFGAPHVLNASDDPVNAAPIYDGAATDLDLSMLDAADDINWENWDELVRQFGMDLDPFPDATEWTGAGNVGNGVAGGRM